MDASLWLYGLTKGKQMAKIEIDVEIPEWANWLAQDKCGIWSVFANTPEMKKGYWDVGGNFMELTRGGGNIIKNWKEQLYSLHWS